MMPLIGSLFTAYATEPEKKEGDFIISAFPNWKGYVKKRSQYYPEKISSREYFRFIVVGVHRKQHHNYFQAIPFRPLTEGESKKYNILDSRDFHKIKDLREVFYETVGELAVEAKRSR